MLTDRILMAPLYYGLAAAFTVLALLAFLLWVLLKVVMRVPIWFTGRLQ